MEEITLRNPSAEEIERLKKNDSIPKAVIMKKEDLENSNKTNSFSNNNSQIPMKKSEEFEPEPELFKLPSSNKVINDKYLTENKEIFVRKLSLKEEGIMGTISKGNSFYKELNTILGNCIKTDISESLLSAIDKIPLIIFILGITYGRKYNIGPLSECKTCGETNEVILDIIKDLEIQYIPEDYEYPFKLNLSYPDSDINLSFHYPRVMNEEILENDSLFEHIKSLIINITGVKKNGKPVSKEDWDAIITYLPQEDKDKITDFINEFSKFGIKLKTDKFSCKKAETEGKDQCEMCLKDKKINVDLERIFTMIASKVTKNKI